MNGLKLVLAFLFFTNLTFGQYSLSGTVTGSDQVPVEFAIVSISNGADMIDHVITDSLGNYEMSGLTAGEYTCLFQYMAYVLTYI